MAVTIEEIREELANQRLTITDGMLRRVMSKVAALEPCFIGSGYTDDDVYFITVYLCCLIALVGSADGRVTSQRSPSGAGRSFQFGTMQERWKSLSSLVKQYDPKGCALSLIPKDPSQKYRCALFVSPGVEVNPQ